jgi:hypothetical protein
VWVWGCGCVCVGVGVCGCGGVWVKRVDATSPRKRKAEMLKTEKLKGAARFYPHTHSFTHPLRAFPFSCGAAGRRRPTSLRAFPHTPTHPHTRSTLSLGHSTFSFGAAGHYPLRAFPHALTHSRTRFALSLGHSTFSFGAAGRRRPTSLRAFPDPFRAAPFSFSVFLFSGDAVALPASRIP